MAMSHPKPQKPPQKRKDGKRGYRLHDERIAYSGGTGSMRSIKYELKVTVSDESGKNVLRDKIADAIAHDNKWLYGNINLNDYLEWRKGKTNEQIKNGEREPSFLGLWIKALSLGFVFSNKIELEFKQYLGIKSEEEKLFDLIPDDLRAKLDKEKWVVWFGKDARTSPKSRKKPEDQIRGKIKEVFLDEHKESEAAQTKADAFWIETTNRNTADFKKKLFDIIGTTNNSALNITTETVYFACDPDFALKNINSSDWTEILDEIIQKWNGKVGEINGKKFLGIGDNGNHFNNGLFGVFLEIIQGNDDGLSKASINLKNIFDFDDTKSEIVLARMKSLSEYAKSIPAKPQLIKKWGDYRSDFNGTIESWYSNRERNRTDALNQFFGKAEKDSETGEEKLEMVGIGVYLEKIKDSLPDDSDIKKGILKETIDYIALLDLVPRRLNKSFTDQLNNYYLPALRDDLNVWSQQDQARQEYIDVKKRKKNAELLPKSWFKVLKKNVQKMPLFFGESKRLEWEQVYNLKSLIKSDVVKLETALSEQTTDSEITDKQIDMLAMLSNRLRDDGNKEVIERLAVIEKKLEITFADRTDKAKYYLSGFECGKYKQLEIKKRINVSNLLELAALGDLYTKLKTAPQNDYILRDTVQLSKIVLSAKVIGADRDRQREIVMTHSNLQGYSSVISKQYFISRYSVQATNGGQSLLALGKSKSKKRNEVERYFYAFPDAGDDFTDQEKIELTKIIKDNAHNPDDLEAPRAKKGVIPKYASLQVCSSRYQIQFLEWFFGKHSKKKTTLTVAGAFTITEKESELDWSENYPTTKGRKEKRVFVSQPFTIVPSKQLEINRDIIKNRYIGVDIGEYGLAWSLIQVDSAQNKVEQLESGFIADNQQQVLKKDVKSWRQNQVRQTFTSPDTKIARLRESLIGSYRNQLEDLAIRKHATLSFEYEVSGFEVGGNRVKTVYDSIKKGSVRRNNDTENIQAWGGEKRGMKLYPVVNNNWAFETTAAGTSRFCTHCKRDNTDFLTKDADEKITESLYDKVRPDLGKGEKRAFAENALKGTPYERIITDEWINQYGTIALFICQNPNHNGKPCGHVTHADKQAAFNIAVRGYLKDSAPEDMRDNKGKVKPGVLTREYLTQAEARLDFEPVGF